MSKNFHLALGPLLFIFCMTGIDEQVMAYQAKAVLASTLWIAIWWITEAIPIAVTSLLPLVLFPLSNGLSIKDTALPYSNPIIYLYAGGFMIALAMEKWMLHKRIALNIILKTGTQMHQLVLGFMIATAFLSMWISNTATSVMMLPIGLAVIQQFQSLLSGSSEGERASSFGKALMLAIAYSASIGGISTLVGSPTNLVVSGYVSEFYQQEIDFTEWMMLGLPISILLLFLCWQHLVHIAYRLDNKPVRGGGKLIRSELLSMGQMSGEEKRVLLGICDSSFSLDFSENLDYPCSSSGKRYDYCLGRGDFTLYHSRPFSRKRNLDRLGNGPKTPLGHTTPLWRRLCHSQRLCRFRTCRLARSTTHFLGWDPLLFLIAHSSCYS